MKNFLKAVLFLAFTGTAGIASQTTLLAQPASAKTAFIEPKLDAVRNDMIGGVSGAIGGTAAITHLEVISKTDSKSDTLSILSAFDPETRTFRALLPKRISLKSALFLVATDASGNMISYQYTIQQPSISEEWASANHWDKQFSDRVWKESSPAQEWKNIKQWEKSFFK